MDKKILQIIYSIILRLLIYIVLLGILLYILHVFGISIKNENNVAAWGQFAVLIITIIDSSINNTKVPSEIRKDKIIVVLEDFRDAIKPFNETIKDSKKIISKETIKSVFVSIYNLCEKINHPIDLYYLENSKNLKKICKKIKKNQYLQSWFSKYSEELSNSNHELKDLIIILHQYSTDEEVIIKAGSKSTQSNKIKTFTKEFLEFIENLEYIILN